MIKKMFIFIFAASCFVNASQVFVNQAGYLTNSVKLVYFGDQADSFFVLELATQKIMFAGKVDLWKSNDTTTGITVYRGNFSNFKISGKYFIRDKNGNKSVSFTIADSVYSQVYRKSLKNFYFQRCGEELLPQYAGVYRHPECHVNDDGIFHQSTDTSGYSDVTGGWHDAGDYGKYVVNAGITVGTLLMAYELFPEKFSADDLNIPESKNKIPDILDEVKYELDWLFKMQRKNGAVFSKVTHPTFEGFVMPQNDTGVRNIYCESSTATADFAAMMARAYRVFKEFDKNYAGKCLSAAKQSWRYLENHPGIFPENGFKNPSDTRTGEYGDRNDSDERLWAAAELFLSTGNKVFDDYFEKNYSMNGIFKSAMGWPNTQSLAQLTYLYGDASLTNKTVVQNLKSNLVDYCNFLVDITDSQGFNTVLFAEQYGWGSNSDILNKAILLLTGYEQTKDQKYYNTALMQINYILGTNVNNISFVTDVGENSPMHPHHRPSGADGIDKPVPGIIVGGANRNREDNTLRSKFPAGTPSALCYTDEQNSYASNENCINWNAPLVFVSGYFNNGFNTSTGK